VVGNHARKFHGVLEVGEHDALLGLGRHQRQGLLYERLLVIAGNQDCLVLWGQVAGAVASSASCLTMTSCSVGW
jgi:hypothetical protein